MAEPDTVVVSTTEDCTEVVPQRSEVTHSITSSSAEMYEFECKPMLTLEICGFY